MTPDRWFLREVGREFIWPLVSILAVAAAGAFLVDAVLAWAGVAP